MTKEIIAKLDKGFDVTADEQLSLAKVFGNVRKTYAKDTELSVYADAIGADHTAERKAFLAKFALQMSHFVKNGTSEVVMCDWVKPADDDDDHRAIRQYRIVEEGKIKPIVTLEVAVDQVAVKRMVNKTEVITYESGFRKEVNALDAEGKAIKVEGIEMLIPRTKTQWGYSPIVKAALLATFTEMGL